MSQKRTDEPWMDELRQRMAEHRETADPKLLGSILAEAQRRGVGVRPQRNYAARYAAAAAVLLICGGGAWWWHKASMGDATEPDTVAATQLAKQEGETREPVVGETIRTATRHADTNDSEPAEVYGEKMLAEAHEAEQDKGMPMQDKTDGQDNDATDKADAAEQGKEKPVQDKSVPKREPVKRSIEDTHLAMNDIAPRHSDDASAWTVQMGYTGGGAASGNGMGMQTGYSAMVMSDPGYATPLQLEGEPIMEQNSQPKMEEPEMEAHHRQPVKVSVQAARALGKGWSVNAGVSYSRLSSDLTMHDHGSSTQYEQTLHFVGIPVAVSKQLWHTNHFAVYATLGGEVQKMVSGSMSQVNALPYSFADYTTDVSMNRLQWSLMGGLGVTYLPTSTIGVFVEPSINRYFDNHHSTRSLYSDHPWRFGLSVGVRVRVNK